MPLFVQVGSLDVLTDYNFNGIFIIFVVPTAQSCQWFLLHGLVQAVLLCHHSLDVHESSNSVQIILVELLDGKYARHVSRRITDGIQGMFVH